MLHCGGRQGVALGRVGDLREEAAAVPAQFCDLSQNWEAAVELPALIEPPFAGPGVLREPVDHLCPVVRALLQQHVAMNEPPSLMISPHPREFDLPLAREEGGLHAAQQLGVGARNGEGHGRKGTGFVLPAKPRKSRLKFLSAFESRRRYGRNCKTQERTYLVCFCNEVRSCYCYQVTMGGTCVQPIDLKALRFALRPAARGFFGVFFIKTRFSPTIIPSAGCII